MLVGWPDFQLDPNQISFLEGGSKLYRFFILNQVTINASVADTSLTTQRNGVRVLTRTEPDSDRRWISEILIIILRCEYFDLEVVWALEHGSFKNDWGMTRIPFYDTVVFDLDIVGFADDFLQLIQILQDVLLKLIGGLDFLGFKLRVIGGLLWFELWILIYWRSLGLDSLGQLFRGFFF